MYSNTTTPPSSPPLGALTDTKTTMVPTKLTSPKSPKLPPRRKRPRVSDGNNDQGYASASSSQNGDLSSVSSDAPFFSSDDLAEADASKYTSPARKKQYRRAWYEPERSESAVSHRLMRTATKFPKDSGIYMNSDSSDSSFSEGFEIETAALNTKAAQTASAKMQAFLQGNDSEQSIVTTSPSQAKPMLSTPKTKDERLVEAKVIYAIEHGKEEIDLSGLDLSALPPECFESLQNFVKQPAFYPNAYTDAACVPLTPSLMIFLANNRLSTVPSSLFDLKYLKALSLRRNQLTELPSAIGRLRNLKELSLDGNPLHSLPWELLPMINGRKLDDNKGQHLTTTSFRVQSSQFALSSLAIETLRRHRASQDYALAKCKCSGKLHVFAQTRKAIFEPDGSLSQVSTVPAPSQLAADEAMKAADVLLAPQSQFKPAETSQRAPSLFSLALSTCGASPSLPDLPAYLPPDTSDTIPRAIYAAQRVVELEGAGGRTCSVCQRRYIIARAEWVEFAWYQISPEQIDTSEPFPFLRRTCSWACAAKAEPGRCCSSVDDSGED